MAVIPTETPKHEQTGDDTSIAVDLEQSVFVGARKATRPKVPYGITLRVDVHLIQVHMTYAQCTVTVFFIRTLLVVLILLLYRLN